MIRRILCSAVLALAFTFTAAAQTSQPLCDPIRTDCTVGEALDFYRGALAEEAVVNANRATTTPDAFAHRIHNSYEDFLNLWSFAINEVDESEDGQSLIVRFNPLRHGRNLLGLTLTVTQPGISEAVLNNIPETVREATTKTLDAGLGDFDDLTWSVSYSFTTPNCLDTTTTCWGRSPATYRDLLFPLVVAITGTDNGAVGDAAQALHDLYPKEDKTDFNERRLSGVTDRAVALQRIQAIVAAERATLARTKAAVAGAHLDLLPTLLDNQPQLTFSGSYHTPGRLGGPNALAATVEFHAGRENLNSLLRRCPARPTSTAVSCMRQELTRLAGQGISTDKFVLTGTYSRTGDYDVTEADLGLPDPLADFVPVALKGSSAWSLKGQAGRELGTEVSGQAVRADASLELVRAKQDGVRTPNRTVGTVTLSIPLGEHITVPLSVTWANKAEFLGDPDERFGAHLGLSYRLPNLFGGGGAP